MEHKHAAEPRLALGVGFWGEAPKNLGAEELVLVN